MEHWLSYIRRLLRIGFGRCPPSCQIPQAWNEVCRAFARLRSQLYDQVSKVNAWHGINLHLLCLSDDWMKKNGFMEAKKIPNTAPAAIATPIPKLVSTKDGSSSMFDFGECTVHDLNLPQALVVGDKTICSEAAKLMQSNSFDQLPVVSTTTTTTTTNVLHSSGLCGLITLGQILSRVANGRAQLTDPVEKIMFHFKTHRTYHEIQETTKLCDLSKFFETSSAAIVTARSPNGVRVVQHVVTKVDLVSFILKRSAIN